MTKIIEEGCKNCKFQYYLYGDAQCHYRPFDCKTPLQKQIVGWLCRVDDAWTASGCPGFESYWKCCGKN